MSVPHIGTQQWISSLSLTTDESWRVWSVDGQTTGWVSKFVNLLQFLPPIPPTPPQQKKNLSFSILPRTLPRLGHLEISGA